MEILISFIIPFIILLTIVVFIHEYGHYYFARKYGVGVTDFSIGFGKELFGFNDKSGTRWKFCVIPLGGYVKFFGDRNVFSQAEQEELLKEYNEEDRKKTFCGKTSLPKIPNCCGRTICELFISYSYFRVYLYVCRKGFYPCKNPRSST